MKILHASTYEQGGGAAIAANRLHRGLLEAGVNSRMAVVVASGASSTVSLVGGTLARQFLRPAAQRMERVLSSAFQKRPDHPAYTTFSLLPSLNAARLNAIPKDILHLHWVGERFLTPFDIAALRGPVVWTMHDTWPFTGGCHYMTANCQRYSGRCGRCPELCSAREYDLSRLHWLAKRRAVRRVSPVLSVRVWNTPTWR